MDVVTTQSLDFKKREISVKITWICDKQEKKTLKVESGKLFENVCGRNRSRQLVCVMTMKFGNVPRSVRSFDDNDGDSDDGDDDEKNDDNVLLSCKQINI